MLTRAGRHARYVRFRYLAPFFLFVYVFVVTIVFVNLLIAQMSHT